MKQAPAERAEALRLLADMNISPKTVVLLRERGWDIVRVPELLPVGATDEQVLERARVEGRVVVTQDLDFSALLALRGEDRPSLITLRLATSDPKVVARRLLQVLPEVAGSLQEGSAITVEESSVRIRRLPVE
jgi:predicted nuclease of predicted toxin-antitoxin system